MTINATTISTMTAALSTALNAMAAAEAKINQNNAKYMPTSQDMGSGRNGASNWQQVEDANEAYSMAKAAVIDAAEALEAALAVFQPTGLLERTLVKKAEALLA